VVDHFYNGIADWLRYDNQGAVLSSGFRHFNFSLPSAIAKTSVGDRSVSMTAGGVFALIV